MGNQKQISVVEKILAIDTSTASLAVAVLNGDKQVTQRHTRAERNHSIHMMKAIEDTLKDAGLALSQMDAIVVGVGPGSYTGIRIAVTTAKTLAWSLNLPVLGSSSLEATALGAFASVGTQGGNTHWVIPLVDARRGQVYTGLYQLTEAEKELSLPVQLESDRITLMTNWCDAIVDQWNLLPEEKRPDGVWFVGETTEAHLSTIQDKLGEVLQERLHTHPYELEAKWLALCGRHALEQGKQSDVHTLVPNYTQLAEAESALLTKK